MNLSTVPRWVWITATCVEKYSLSQPTTSSGAIFSERVV